MSLLEEDSHSQNRFFTDQEKDHDNDDQQSIGPGDAGEDENSSDGESGDLSNKKCLTLRFFQRICPCLQKRTLWNTSQNNIFKLNEVEETKYPLMLTILEHPAFDIVSVIAAVLSIFLLLFSEGFLIDGAILWGIIHLINTVYTLCVCGRWLEILLKSKYAKTNQRYFIRDIVYSLLSVVPLDIIVLLTYNIVTNQADRDNIRHADLIWLTPVRMLYLTRARTVIQFFNKYEDLLQIDDMRMYIGRAVLYTLTLVHFMACSWHRIHCEGLMGTYIVRHGQVKNQSFHRDDYEKCYEQDWIKGLQIPDDGPFRGGKGWNKYLQHYFVAIYWSTLTCFRLGASSIKTYLNSQWEIFFSIVGQILSWAFVVMYVSGGLTALLVEIDSEREDYLNRRFAIEKYLNFAEMSKRVRADVERFYNYLWTRSRGIRNWDMVKDIPHTMKSQIYYDINKFIVDQLPILSNLEEGFLINLSVRMKHSFFVKGEILHRRGETGSNLFYVISGFLEVMSYDGSFVITEIRCGSAIGEIYLLQSFPCVATVRCGSECDIMTLSKQDFKEVLENYPNNRQMLFHRLEMRLEQSGLLLGLCERHNEYPPIFKQLMEIFSESEGRRSRLNSYRSFDEFDIDESENAWEDSAENERPGSLSAETIRRLRNLAIATEAPLENVRALEASACAAVESDVHRAGNLARDLHMARPPLIVTQPRNLKSSRTSGARASRFSARDKMIPKMVTEKHTPHKWSYKFWKFVVAVSSIAAFCFYTYQIAFADHRLYYLVYAWHTFDVVFLADFILDMFFISINTRHRLIETPLEIAAYNVKTFEFWLRLIAFLPFEYAIGPLPFVQWAPDSSETARFYAILKLNRILQYRQCLLFFQTFNENGHVSRIILPYVRFILKLFFVAHITACVMEVIIRHTHRHSKNENVPELVNDKFRYYEFVFYWACQVVTGTGFGDIDLKSSWEFAVSGIGLVVGTLTLIYLNGRISCVMVNSERRRMAFHQVYYSLKKFMKKRRFPQWLVFRIRTYFRIQWTAHEGTLIPNKKTAIWDAPTTLFNNVCLAQSQKYVEMIPLFRYCNDALIVDICSVLKQYVIPPHQVILYPCDRARSLYIIVKGHCMVTYKGEQLGMLGEGRYVGLPGLVYGRNKPAKISTITHCQFFCLEYDDFSRISKKYPKFLAELKVLRGETVSKPKSEDFDPYDEPEIPLPTRDDAGDFPPLFNDFEVDDTADNDSEAEKVENCCTNTKTELTRALKTSFVKTPRKSCISYVFSSITVLPSGPFLKWWTVFRVLCALIVGNFVPVQAVFPVKPTTAFSIVLFFDIVAWIDMFLCFHVAYYGYDNMLVADRKRTVIHYLSSSFLLDFLGSFPIDYIVMMVYPDSVGFGKKHFFTTTYQIIALCRLNRIIQLHRVLAWGYILDRGIFKSLSFLTLVQVVPLMFLYINIMCCISFALVCKPSNTFIPFEELPLERHNKTHIVDENEGLQLFCKEKGWIMGGELYNNFYQFEVKEALTQISIMYTISLYFVTESAFCVGFGDLDILQSSLNRQLAIFLMISGAVVCAYLISKFTACFVGEDPRRIEIRNRTKVIFRFLDQFKVPKSLRRRVEEACFAEWDKTSGIFPKDLFAALPPSLKVDAFKCLYEDCLRLSPMFKDLDKGGIRMLSSKLVEMNYPEGEYVFKYGDLNDDIYFIARGVVVSYTKNGDLIKYIGPGSLVGEMPSLQDIQRMFTLFAGTDVQLYVFKKEDFLEFLNLYPDIRETCEKLSAIHYKETIEATIRRTLGHTATEPGENVDSPKSNKSEKYRRSGIVIIQPNSTDLHSKQNQVLMAEAVLDPLRLPAFIEEGDNIRNSININRMSRNVQRSPSCCEKFVSFFITFGRKPRDQMGIFHFVPEKSKLTWRSAVIHPSSPICNYSIFYLFLTAISCGLTIFEIFFTPYKNRDRVVTLYIRIFLEVFFAIRIIGNFRLAYFDENSELISNPCLIVKRYVLSPTGLWIDMVSTLPFWLIIRYSNESSFQYNQPIRFHQLLRFNLMFRYLRDTELKLRMKVFHYKAITICLFLSFTFHICACAWVSTAIEGPEINITSGSWMMVLYDREVAKARADHIELNYTHQFIKPNYSIAHKYLLSVYYVCSAITFTGLGDVAAKFPYELQLTIVMIFVTVFVLGYLVGEITQALASKVGAKMRYKHRLQVMEHHFQYLGLGQTRIDEIKKYFMLLWSRLYGRLDKDIIRQLSAEIRHEMFLPGTHIVRSGDICQAVYFIKKGEVVIIDESPGIELCVEILYENECFGEVKTVLTGLQFRFSYVARLETEVGVLFHDDLIRILKRHGRVYDDILEKAKEMREKKLHLAREHEKSARLSRQLIKSKRSTGSVGSAAGHLSPSTSKSNI